jgi:SAM-dependent methyltransferase
MGSRVNDAVDRARFRIDTIPRSERVSEILCSDHQDLPWLGVPGRRARGNESRWQAIAPVLRQTETRTALDLGCNVGFFTLYMGFAGVASIGVENHPTFYRSALYAVRRLELSNVGILVITLGPATVDLLPTCDAVLFLALWHHLVQSHGLEQATSMLRTIWAKTRRVLIFETGQDEMPPSFGLPSMTPDPRSWLTRYLEESCEGSTVTHLGMHSALAPDGTECKRNLFAVLRLAGPSSASS